MKYFSIPEPCSENWNQMSPTEKGAFCQKCSNEVHDVSNMSSDQIINLITSEKKAPCMRMTPNQEFSLNLALRDRVQSKKKHMQRAMLFSLLVVFGFTLFSCNSSQQIHERNILQTAAETMVSLVEENSVIPGQNTKIERDTAEPKKGKSVTPKSEIEHEVFMLGEPVIHEEVIVQDTVVLIEEPYHEEIYHTMGVPAIIWDERLPEVIIDETVVHEVNVTRNSDNSVIPEIFSALTFPNPATTNTRLEVKLPNDTESLGIRLLSLNGEVLQDISESSAKAGVHEFKIDLTGLSPAYYLIDVRYNDKHEVVRLSKAH